MISRNSAFSSFLAKVTHCGLVYRRVMIVLSHAGLVALAFTLAFLIRFDFRLTDAEWDRLLLTLPLILVIRAVVFSRFHLYKGLWQYISVRDFVGILKAVTLGS